MPNSPDVSEVIAEFGPYKETRAKEIFTEIMKDSNIERFMTHVPNVDGGTYRMLMSVLDEIMQPFQETWTPKGTMTFLPNEILMRRAKIDNEYSVDHLFQSWMSFLVTEGIDRKDMPISKYLIQEIGVKLSEENGLLSVNGEYVPYTPGVAGGFLSTCDGILTQLNTFETNDDGVNLIPIGNLDTDPYQKVHAFVRAMTKAELRACGKIIFASTSMVDTVADDWQDANPYKDVKWLGDKSVDHIIELPNTGGVKLIGIEGMDDSKRIWATPKKNMLKLYDKVKGLRKFDIQKEKRMILILGDFSIAYGFGFKELIFTNDANAI